MFLVRAYLLMIVLGIIYHYTGWTVNVEHHNYIVALGYWWCAAITYISALLFKSTNVNYNKK